MVTIHRLCRKKLDRTHSRSASRERKLTCCNYSSNNYSNNNRFLMEDKSIHNRSINNREFTITIATTITMIFLIMHGTNNNSNNNRNQCLTIPTHSTQNLITQINLSLLNKFPLIR